MKEKVLALLQDVMPGIDFESSNTLADDGVIDSLSVVNIIAEISMEFGITVPFEEIKNENFNSIDAIAALVEKLS